MSADSETLHRINDVLTSLAAELRVEWTGDAQEDMVLDDLTWKVFEAFGLDENGEKCPSCGQSYKDAHAGGCEFGDDILDRLKDGV